MSFTYEAEQIASRRIVGNADALAAQQRQRGVSLALPAADWGNWSFVLEPSEDSPPSAAVVVGVTAGSEAQLAGLQAGMAVVAVQNLDVSSSEVMGFTFSSQLLSY
jgi:membrane-associated protease RseP (regulator of RpoE activity)